ncbi:MAG: ATP-binding protein [Paludibacteraceae bacterium]|nr:ATP-binding protein [Paludibacteraceae bacterium]
MYKQRIADTLLERKLLGKGAVLIEGPKWCGKTTTAHQFAKSVLDLGDSLVLKQSSQMMEVDSKLLLQGETPRLIDEWQTLPAIWDSVRNEIDKRNQFAQFILTGSSVLPDPNATIHSGTGRFARIKMRPMSLFESGESSGSISLKALFDGDTIEFSSNKLQLTDIAFLLCRGGWPQTTFMSNEIALEQAFDYLDSIVQNDLYRVDGVFRNPDRSLRLLRSYARNISQQVSLRTICDDIKTNDTFTLSEDTIADYISALRKLYVIEDLSAWNPNLRSKAAIRVSDTRHFVDPSIAVAALGIGPNDLMNDLETFGLLFENMAVRDLRVYAEVLDGTLYHYRDSDKLECDAVLHRRNGTYGLIEIKLGGQTKIEEGVKSLKILEQKLDTTRMSKPSFLMVLTAVGDFAYKREDGVWVVPIGCLKN